jgi:hypothetical protein
MIRCMVRPTLSRTVALTLALTVATAGCATYAWEKAGTTPTLVEEDTRECQQIAQRIANDYDFWTWGGRAWPGRWPGSPVWSPDPYFGPSSFELEQRAVDRCMESKGYRLVKQPKPAS